MKNIKLITKELKDSYDDWSKLVYLLEEKMSKIENEPNDDLNEDEYEIYMKHKWQDRLLNVYHTENKIIFAKSNNKIIGMLSYSVLRYISPQDYSNTYYIMIQELFIKEKFRSLGLGKYMMNHLKKTYPKIYEINVGTVTHNKPALNFYEKMGFKITGYDLRWYRE